MRSTFRTRRLAGRLAVALTTVTLLAGLGAAPAQASCGDPSMLEADSPGRCPTR